MRLVGRRGTDELRRVYLEHVDAVYAFFSYSLDRTWAEDLTASTFERVIRSWSSYDPKRAGERTWILSIARNLLTDHYRRQSHRRATSTNEHPVLLDSLVSTEDVAEATAGTDQVRSWLEQLGDREREILALRYAADLPAAEIAALMGLSEANVHQVTSRSLRKLR